MVESLKNTNNLIHERLHINTILDTLYKQADGRNEITIAPHFLRTQT